MNKVTISFRPHQGLSNFLLKRLSHMTVQKSFRPHQGLSNFLFVEFEAPYGKGELVSVPIRGYLISYD